MNHRQLRARIVLDEARALGLGLADLIAADIAGAELPTVGSYIAEIAPTFSAATAATYRPYWRLAARELGDRRLAEITVTDLAAIVAEAGARATRNRSTSTGRASRETCVAALRALFGRAHTAGLTQTNTAAVLSKPRRVRSRRRALDDGELAELIDAVRTTSNDPDLDLLIVRFHLETGARREGALNLRQRDLDCERATVWLREKGTANANNRPHLPFSRSSNSTRPDAVAGAQTTRSYGTATGHRSRLAATTRSSNVPAPVSLGPSGHLCRPTSCATPRSPRSAASPATPLPKPSPATPRYRSPAATSTPTSARSPPR